MTSQVSLPLLRFEPLPVVRRRWQLVGSIEGRRPQVRGRRRQVREPKLRHFLWKVWKPQGAYRGCCFGFW